MSYHPYSPKQVYIETAAQAYPATQKILSQLPPIHPIVIEDFAVVPAFSGTSDLILAKQKANFYKTCPGTQNYICCGYKILNLINNCELNCSYCILQGYLDHGQIIIYVNIEEMFDELDCLFKAHPQSMFRIGTGELADSLSTDHLTGYSRALVSYFADKANAIIELKTKTTQIENFLNLAHGGRTVVSWSLNTPTVIAQEEAQAPDLDQRLRAAQTCQKAGFKIGFHFDPMIHYPNWEQEYKLVVDRIFDYIKPENIIWISLGALRYPPHLDQIIRERHPMSRIVYGELIRGLDGKYRYFKPIRFSLFSKMYHWIKHHDEKIFVYLCMESHEVWQKSFGWSPGNSATLNKLMDDLIR